MTLPKMLAVLSAASVFSAMAQGSRWQYIGIFDKASLYIDTQSIVKIGDRVKIWAKDTYAQPEEVPSLVLSGQAVQSWRVLFSFDCAARTMAILELRAYADIDANGKLVESTSYEDTPSEYKNVAPESGVERLFNYACHP